MILGELSVVPEEEQTDEANKKYNILFYAAALFSLVKHKGIKAGQREKEKQALLQQPTSLGNKMLV